MILSDICLIDLKELDLFINISTSKRDFERVKKNIEKKISKHIDNIQLIKQNFSIDQSDQKESINEFLFYYLNNLNLLKKENLEMKNKYKDKVISKD